MKKIILILLVFAVILMYYSCEYPPKSNLSVLEGLWLVEKYEYQQQNSNGEWISNYSEDSSGFMTFTNNLDNDNNFFNYWLNDGKSGGFFNDLFSPYYKSLKCSWNLETRKELRFWILGGAGYIEYFTTIEKSSRNKLEFSYQYEGTTVRDYFILKRQK